MTVCPIHPSEVQPSIKMCIEARTWRPYALGILGTKKGEIMLSKRSDGMLSLPVNPIGRADGWSPIASFEPAASRRVARLAGFAIYDMQNEEAEGFAGYVNGQVYYAVSATLPDSYIQPKEPSVFVPADEVLDVLKLGIESLPHARTHLAIIAIQEYRAMLTAG